MKYPVFYIVFDFETSGLSSEKNQATQIALVVLDGTLNEVERYSTYIQQYDSLVIDSNAMRYNNTTLEDLKKGITADQLYLILKEKFIKYKAGRYGKPVLVGHNIAEFDMGFMQYLFKRKEDNLYNYINKWVEDTIGLSRTKWGEDDVENHKLGGLCTRIGVEANDLHEALNDTLATAECFKYFVGLLRSSGEYKGSGIAKQRVQFYF